MRITEINKLSDFAALKNSWDNLLQRSDHTIFQTWEWLYTWWKHFQNNRRLLILLAEENGKLLGIAPLMISLHSMHHLRRLKIEFIGTGPVNYADFIIENNSMSLGPFLEYINNLQEKWESIDLGGITINQFSLKRLQEVSENVRPRYCSLYTKLPSSMDAYLKDIKYKKRKEFRRYFRRLEKTDVSIELVDCAKRNLVEGAMNELFALSTKRWNAKGLPGAFDDLSLRSFYMEIACVFLERGWLGLHCLKLSGKTVAVLFGFKYGNKYIAYKTGMDPAYRRLSIGNVLFMKVMEECIKEGLNEFDFMWGQDSYKKQWQTIERIDYKIVIARKQRFGSFKHFLFEKYWRAAESLDYYIEDYWKGVNSSA
jgi:CelD/BcsL family acetyltransferase involved in cellulose biosynthesis